MIEPSTTSHASPSVLEGRGMTVTLGARQVLKDVSFVLNDGEMMGLLGPNGSGKTTLFRSLLGLILPEAGSCRLWGNDISFGARALRQALGVVFQEPSLDKHLTARENLLLGARLFGVRGTEGKKRAAELLAFFDLERRQDDRVSLFSGGMKRRLEIARALISDPQVLILDEPTAGLDPPARDRVWQRLMKLQKVRGLSLLVATHSADEAAFCDRLMVLDRGQVVATETPKDLLAKVAGDLVSMDTATPAALQRVFVDKLNLPSTLIGRSVQVTVADGAAFVARLVEAAGPSAIERIVVSRPSLSTVFSSLTGRPLEALASEEREGL